MCGATPSGEFSVWSLIDASVYILRQGHDILSRIEDDLYVRPHPPQSAYGIGAHLRHCLDAYDCFLHGLPVGLIDYDCRERQELIATSRAAAMDKIAATMELLQVIPGRSEVGELQVRQDGADFAPSSLERELQFLLSHTIHHYAIIALLLRWQGVELPADFGVAPSTLAYWQASGQ